MRKLAILVAAAAVGLVMAMGGQALAATTWIVNDGTTEASPCDGTPDFTGVNAIQDAIDDASTIPGDTVMVCPGTYSEQVVVITDDLSLVSAVPQDAIIDGTGMAVDGAVVHVNGAIGVSIRDFTIIGPTTGGAIGIYVSGGGDATIDGNEIDGFVQGIWVGRHKWSAVGTATITNNLITGYFKGGIVVDNAGSDATIAENMVYGSGLTGSSAQNGIQVSRWATAEVKRNTVDGNWYSGDKWTATGILVFETQDVMVQRNVVVANQTGIAIETHGWLGQDANDNRAIKNSVTGSDYGISVSSYDLPWTTWSSTANNNKVTNNTITGPVGDGEVGILVGAFDDVWGGSLNTPSVDNNKVIRNEISGYSTDIDTSSAPNAKVHANVLD